LINNRQSGRRRGRGGGQRSPNNMPNPGNRQDNRQRGNAAQLHEKYKALARDAQLSGDRVQTEYYLQFADHYFRILNEGRARFEEQRRQRDDYSPDEEEQDEVLVAEGDEGGFQERRPDRPDRGNGMDGRGRNREERRPRIEAREEEVANEEENDERISLDVLPPAISAESETPRPTRRRTRRPRADEGDSEIAPAA
jgi:hypothetical protein